jgi:hypothetical protein
MLRRLRSYHFNTHRSLDSRLGSSVPPTVDENVMLERLKAKSVAVSVAFFIHLLTESVTGSFATIEGSFHVKIDGSKSESRRKMRHQDFPGFFERYHIY